MRTRSRLQQSLERKPAARACHAIEGTGPPARRWRGSRQRLILPEGCPAAAVLDPRSSPSSCIPEGRPRRRADVCAMGIELARSVAAACGSRASRRGETHSPASGLVETAAEPVGAVHRGRMATRAVRRCPVGAGRRHPASSWRGRKARGGGDCWRLAGFVAIGDGGGAGGESGFCAANGGSEFGQGAPRD